jgi:hypothetical protein
LPLSPMDITLEKNDSAHIPIIQPTRRTSRRSTTPKSSTPSPPSSTSGSSGVTGASTRGYTSCFSWLEQRYLEWKANLRVLEIEEIQPIPHVPMSHPFVERLIGSIRRELLDHTLFWTATGSLMLALRRDQVPAQIE